jgi:ABC-type multidrug transport system fused ATPase/permease subunit
MALRPLLTIDKYLHAAFSLIGYLVVMSLISWRLTLFAIPLFLLLHLAMRGIIMAIHRYSRAIAESLSALGKKVVEILSTMPLVLAMGTQDLERHRYKAISAQHAHLAYRSHATEELVRPLQEFLTLLSMLALFTIMLYLLVIRGESTASSFLVYFYLVFNAAGKFGTLTGFRSSLAVASAPLHEVLEVFNDRDKERVPEGSVEFSSLRERIDVRHLHFRYQEREEVLQDVSFTAERGTVTALVGATGAGKTTFIHLLLRFYDCPPGTILLDGRDIRSFTIQSLRAHMALVSQETLLLNDTLRNNLSYGVGEVPAKHLHAVLERARLTDFVSKLPHGLETRIGDRGVKLSGGEKQRVAIARALLRDADILLLDEATSALDSRTERLIQEAIDEAIQGKTAFVIAHRLSTIRHADRIIVLDGGRCVEQGTLEELLERKGTFYAFWEEQRFW